MSHFRLLTYLFSTPQPYIDGKLSRHNNSLFESWWFSRGSPQTRTVQDDPGFDTIQDGINHHFYRPFLFSWDAMCINVCTILTILECFWPHEFFSYAVSSSQCRNRCLFHPEKGRKALQWKFSNFPLNDLESFARSLAGPLWSTTWLGLSIIVFHRLCPDTVYLRIKKHVIQSQIQVGQTVKPCETVYTLVN